jgi:hypothetical protein
MDYGNNEKYELILFVDKMHFVKYAVCDCCDQEQKSERAASLWCGYELELPPQHPEEWLRVSSYSVTVRACDTHHRISIERLRWHETSNV